MQSPKPFPVKLSHETALPTSITIPESSEPPKLVASSTRSFRIARYMEAEDESIVQRHAIAQCALPRSNFEMLDPVQGALQAKPPYPVIPLRCSTTQKSSSMNKNTSPTNSPERLRSTTNRDMHERTKFSFPIPKRRSLSWVAAKPGVRPCTPASPLDADEGGKSRRTSRNIRFESPPSPSLEDYPRYMTISIAEPDPDSDLWEQDTMISEQSAIMGIDPEESTRPSSRDLHHRPSSTVLGRRAEVDRRSITDSAGSATHRIIRVDSSATLRSFYDAKRSPLAISQQTSASSTRDFALRKGCTAVIEPLMEEEFVFPAPPRSSGHIETSHRRSLLGLEGTRDLQLDLSKTISNSYSVHGPLLSPTRLTYSPSSISLRSDQALTPAEATQPSRALSCSSKSHASPLSEPKTTSEQETSSITPYPYMEVTSTVLSSSGRRLSRQSDRSVLSSRIEDKSNVTDSKIGPEIKLAYSPKIRGAAGGVSPMKSRRHSTTSLHSVNISIASSGHLSVPSRCSTKGFRMSLKPSDHKESTQAWADQHWIKDTPATLFPSPRRISRHSTDSVFQKVDLQEQSILDLSSSDEEDLSDDASTAETSLTTMGDDFYEADTSIWKGQRSNRSSISHPSVTQRPAHTLRINDLPSQAPSWVASDEPSNQSAPSPAPSFSSRNPTGQWQLPSEPKPDEIVSNIRPNRGGSNYPASSRTSWLDLRSPSHTIKSIMRHPAPSRGVHTNACETTPEESSTTNSTPVQQYSDKIHCILGPDAPRSSSQYHRRFMPLTTDEPQIAYTGTVAGFRGAWQETSRPRVSFDVEDKVALRRHMAQSSTDPDSQYVTRSTSPSASQRPSSPAGRAARGSGGRQTRADIGTRGFPRSSGLRVINNGLFAKNYESIWSSGRRTTAGMKIFAIGSAI